MQLTNIADSIYEDIGSLLEPGMLPERGDENGASGDILRESRLTYKLTRSMWQPYLAAVVLCQGKFVLRLTEGGHVCPSLSWSVNPNLRELTDLACVAFTNGMAEQEIDGSSTWLVAGIG